MKKNSITLNSFEGCLSFKQLRKEGYRKIPQDPGVYIIIYKGKNPPKYLITGTGGHYKGLDPNELVTSLKRKWIKNTKIIYIGKGNNLRSRIKLYSHFGNGEPVAHRGGRFIWQLEGSENLIVAWKLCTSSRSLEKDLIEKFVLVYGSLPFANIIH